MAFSRDPRSTGKLRPMDPQDERTLLARRLPKAELHMHQLGCLSPSETARLSYLRTGERADFRIVSAMYDNRGVGKFFDDLDRAARFWNDEGAVLASSLHMIAAAYDRGVRHLELLCTPDLHRQQTGMSPHALLRALGHAFDIAGEHLGLTGGIIVETHRYDGGDAAIRLVEETAGLCDQGVPLLGYGNDGDHRTVPFEDLAAAYVLARSEGLMLTGHADVFDDVHAALDIGLDRIDHGWMAADDPATVSRLASSGTPLTFTPASYALGGLKGTIPYHEAWRTLSGAGIVIALGTDDPELHHTDLAQDYATMARKLDWSKEQLGAAAKNSFRASWLSGPAGEAVRATWFAEIDALVADPRSPQR